MGAYNDVLVPSGSGGTVVDNLPTPNAFPFYAEVDFDAIMEAFGIADQGSTIAQRGVIYTQAISLLLSFGVQPLKQAVSATPTDWDANSQYGLSYRQVVLNPAFPYPPCVAGPNPGGAQNATFLQMVEAGLKSGAVAKGAFIYLYDEPTQAQHADLITQAKAVRANAPDLKIMVTMQPTTDVAGLVDIYTGIFESGPVTPGPYTAWAYGSCSSAGTCSNGSPGTPTGTPMLALDADPVNWTAYPVVAAGLGAQAALYYETTLSIGTAMQPGGQYKFGNNGDGNLLYAGTNSTVWPSARLLGIKKGLAKLAATKGKSLAGLVTNAKIWDHNLGDYTP